MKIIALGTAGFFPSRAGRETCSVLVCDDTRAVLFDAGTGVRWLNDPGIEAALGSVKQLDVIFSHFHHDHVAGLTWLLRLWPRRLVFHVPTSPDVETDGRIALEELSSPPYFALRLSEWQQRPTIHLIRDRAIEIGDWRVEALPQEHSGRSVSYRLGPFVYVQDTDPGPAHITFARGARLLLVDTMHDRREYARATSNGQTKAQHGSSETSARLALDAEVERVGLIHLDPLFDDEDLARLLGEAKELHPHAFIPNEKEVLEL